MPAALQSACIHDRRVRLLQRFRLQAALLDSIEAVMSNISISGPFQLHTTLSVKRPLEMWSIAARWGGNDRMIERHVRRGDHAAPRRGCRNVGRPRIGLKPRTLRIVRAAEPPPARHRHEHLKLHLVGEFCQRYRV
jgi:hypothetical protein